MQIYKRGHVQTSVDVGLRSERGPILLALMVSTGLVAIDATIIATAVPSVVTDLGGFAQFPWLFSVFLLAQAVTVPIYGKLADLFGRKPIILFGIGLFLVASVLCGLAWSMPALIVFRALQGLGAGAIQPISLTIAGDIYSLAERGKVQGYLASVWGISAIAGPTLGGVFAQYLTWRWIFFINIPLCLLAAFMLGRNLTETVERKKHQLDYLGAALLSVGAALLILGMLEGGEAWPWISLPGIGIPAAGVVLLAWFIAVERRAAEPVLPLWIFRHRFLVIGCLIAVGVGAVLIGLTSYVPTYVQAVLHTSPLTAGFTLAMMTIGWPITASLSSRVYLRLGFRVTALIGSAATLCGTVLLTVSSSVASVALSCFIIGAGLGFVASPTLIAAQSTVGWSDRGVVTGANMFSRSMGSAVGVALFGAMANATLRRDGAALAVASQRVFLAVAILALLMGVAVAFLPTLKSV
ncbi:MDR family MFS transporter [Catelliglobosispora koreensis]|uniref:MDR family MFS transporter n=1 Tax=Catelliglobosispora koreensis TaxID=129052 RepID=UPI000684F1C4|nr:MDR family MFS transporter [Catelliglobosispora koreensis]